METAAEVALKNQCTAPRKSPPLKGEPDALARDWGAVRKSATGLHEDCTILDRLMSTHVRSSYSRHMAHGEDQRGAFNILSNSPSNSAIRLSVKLPVRW